MFCDVTFPSLQHRRDGIHNNQNMSRGLQVGEQQTASLAVTNKQATYLNFESHLYCYDDIWVMLEYSVQ